MRPRALRARGRIALVYKKQALGEVDVVGSFPLTKELFDAHPELHHVPTFRSIECHQLRLGSAPELVAHLPVHETNEATAWKICFNFRKNQIHHRSITKKLTTGNCSTRT